MTVDLRQYRRAGINMAQRVMDCGDAGHILLSTCVAEDLEQYRLSRARRGEGWWRSRHSGTTESSRSQHRKPGKSQPLVRPKPWSLGVHSPFVKSGSNGQEMRVRSPDFPGTP
jgi:hypothetical protein